MEVRHQLKTEGVHWLTKDMVMEFLPPSDKERMSYCCWCKEPGIHSWAALVLKDPSGLYVIFDLLFGFEEFMKK
jgi:hypothetical protein